MKKRVVVTGMAGISPLGSSWEAILAKLKDCTNAVRRMEDWKESMRAKLHKEDKINA